MNLLDALAAYARKTPFPEAGEYWSGDNARFEAGNPTLLDRVARTLNPMTGFGSAMGAMNDAAEAGSVRDAGLAFLQSLPLFGALRAVNAPAQGVAKAVVRLSPDLLKFARDAGISVAGSAAIDETQAGER